MANTKDDDTKSSASYATELATDISVAKGQLSNDEKIEEGSELIGNTDNPVIKVKHELNNLEESVISTKEVMQKGVTEVDPLKNMPFIPDNVFSSLPELLQDGCNCFSNKRERDVFLTSALSVLSGCFTSVSGVYRQNTVYPNLFSFIVAPAASGKGAMTYSKQLGSKIHNSLVEESNENRRRYDLEMKLNTGKKGKKKNDNFTPAPAPPFKVLFIPGDVSSARVIEHLSFNGGSGIFCETEADTMGGSFKQDWGGFSDKLRKAFHHEPISYSRKGGQEFREVQCPRLSVALSGTPSQVQGIINSADDGLFSRFIYYIFEEEPVWHDVSPKNKRNLTEYFSNLSEKVAGYAVLMNQSKTKFDLTESQWNYLNEVFGKWLLEMSTLFGDDSDSSIKRLGLILFRVAMVLSVVKQAEKGERTTEIICEDSEFNAAFALVQTFKEHAMVMCSNLPKSASKIDNKNKRNFYGALPEGGWFKRKEAVEIGKAFNIKERSVDNYLKLFVKRSLLETGAPGLYKKISLQTLQTLQTVNN